MSERDAARLPPVFPARPAGIRVRPVLAAGAARRALARLQAQDPRLAVAGILFTYLVLGFTVLGFNRTPFQAMATTLAACSLEVGLCYAFKRRWVFPLSAMITSFGLSILLNYSHSFLLLLVPVTFAIGSKYVFTFNGRHAYNPAQIGVTLSLLTSQELITSAPAYQWNGLAAMSIFIVAPALLFFMRAIQRTALVTTFLLTYTAYTALRAWVMRHHLPFETLFLGTLSSPSFFLFTFFMITDPATSPPGKKAQIAAGIGIATLDLLLHVAQSYYTFFYAAFLYASGRLVYNHARAALATGALGTYLRTRFLASGYWRQLAVVLGLTGVLFVGTGLTPLGAARHAPTGWHFAPVAAETSAIDSRFGDVYERVDPRMQHIIKWLLSIGASVATADYDGDGRPDLFFTEPLMTAQTRTALYRNLGGFRFEKVEVPALSERNGAIEAKGLPTNAMFVDYDGDGDQDLFLTYAFGTPLLLQNQLKETGRADLLDVTAAAGLDFYTNAVAANFLDIDGDGRLDLVIGQIIPENLPDYAEPTRLNFFKLPQAQYAGDDRMFHFMHESWHEANNGGRNLIFLATPDHRFVQHDPTEWNFLATRWTQAIGTGDFNQDGRTDLYVANDFGPDDLYLNVDGKTFYSVKGKMFGSIGRDTYKGMNASVADLDRNGWLDVYVSNVHHALQAEGSLLWMFSPPPDAGAPFLPTIEDKATGLGALNERRFGWGASVSDFDNDGWVDIAQANGMVDDAVDKKWADCPDYWYINEKVARSAPEIHSHINKWADIRGRCIYGTEQNRLYLNRGAGEKPQFVDVADEVGLTARGNSRGMAAVDLDGDGRLDLVTTHMFQRPDLFRNVADDARAKAAHWVGIDLVGDGSSCNRQGVGSTVTIRYRDAAGGEARQRREVQVVNGLDAQDDARLHFGLGPDVATVDAVVRWCGKHEVVYRDLAAGAYRTLRQ